MKLLDYLKPMETLPNRFSNLAFWRILRIFKDTVVDAFTYVYTWGTDIEKEQATQNGILTTHGTMLNSHESEISSLNTEETSQNKRITALEFAESTSSGKVSDLEESVKTLNSALESVEKEQSTQNTDIDGLKSDVSTLTGDIETILDDQATQNLNIATNMDNINAVNTNLGTIIPLVYNGKVTNFKVSAYTDPNATFKQLVGALYVVTTTTVGLDFPSVPFHVATRASIVVYTNEGKTSSVTINVPMTHIITMISGKTRILWQPTPFYAPYGVERLTGMYVTYISHI